MPRSSIPTRTATLIIGCLLAFGAQAQVYRCEVNGKVTITDMPCASAGKIVAPTARSTAPAVEPARVVPTLPYHSQVMPAPAPGRPVLRAPVTAAAPEPGACPSDTDVANINTRLSARVHPPSNVGALRAELSKAQRCRVIAGRYSHDDWQRLQAVLRGDH